MHVVWKKCKEELAKQFTLADGGGEIYKDEWPARENQYRKKSSKSWKKKTVENTIYSSAQSS